MKRAWTNINERIQFTSNLSPLENGVRLCNRKIFYAKVLFRCLFVLVQSACTSASEWSLISA